MANGWLVEYQETVIRTVLVPWEDAKSKTAARRAVETNGPERYETTDEGDAEIKIISVERNSE